MNGIAQRLEENAAQIIEHYGFDVLPGTRHIMIVKQVPVGKPTHLVCLHQTLFNWRLVQIPLRDLGSFERGWCYTGPIAFGVALGHAMGWPDADDGTHMPQLWYRDLNTDVRQPEYFFA